MTITNPEAVRFCNEKARVFADALLQAINTADTFLREWNANTGLAVALPNTAEDVGDGSALDGRHGLTGVKINALITAANDIMTWANTGSPTRRDRLNTIAVNAQSRY